MNLKINFKNLKGHTIGMMNYDRYETAFVGCNVDLPDGAYVLDDGVVIIQNKIYVTYVETLYARNYQPIDKVVLNEWVEH